MISEKNQQNIFLIFLAILSIYFLYLASQTDLLGEDETFYYATAQDFYQGKFPVWNPVTDRQNVPVGSFISSFYSFFFLFTGPSLAIAKMISVVFGILTVFMVYLIGKKFDIFYGIFSSILLFSIAFFTHFMMIAYVEIPIAFFSILIVYLFLFLNNWKMSIIIGIFMALSFFVKSSGLFFVPLLIFYVIIFKRNKIKFAIISLIIFMIMLMPFIIRNLTFYGYPFVNGLNAFFKPFILEKFDIGWITELQTLISPVRLSLQTFTSTFGWLGFAIFIFGFSWFLINFNKIKKENEALLLITFSFIVFILAFFGIYYTNIIPLETRYLSMIFPQLALLGGLFLWKMKEWNKFTLVIIIPILIFSLWSGVVIAQNTQNTQRYPDDYKEALQWIKTNTPKDAIFFTTYWGSLKYYGDRDSVWSDIRGFPDIMSSSNSTYIYENLTYQNVSYIFAWRATIAQDYVIPESNLWGVFTFNFMNTISSDTEHFEQVFGNQNNWVFKVL